MFHCNLYVSRNMSCFILAIIATLRVIKVLPLHSRAKSTLIIIMLIPTQYYNWLKMEIRIYDRVFAYFDRRTIIVSRELYFSRLIAFYTNISSSTTSVPSSIVWFVMLYWMYNGWFKRFFKQFRKSTSFSLNY